MKITNLFIFLIIGCSLNAQQAISGKVTDTKGLSIEGANVYLDGTYDGATTNEEGLFNFETSEAGTQTLVVSFLSYETKTMSLDVSLLNNVNVKLREDANTLDAVVLSAGTFEASDNSKVSVLKPLDVVTTASALVDFVGAIPTLPSLSLGSLVFGFVTTSSSLMSPPAVLPGPSSITGF